jgi:hypothetical protein
MYSTSWKLIQRGHAGWYAKADNVSSSGGSLNAYVNEAVNGATVIDSENVPFEKVAELAISGPLVDTSLPVNTVSKFTDFGTLRRMMPGLEGDFNIVGKAVLTGLSSFDKVSLDLFVNLYRDAGAKVGKVIDGKIVWE